jgi:hypothetical protein
MNQTPNQHENGTNERKPPPLFKLIVVVLFMAVAWWIWKPLGAYYTILTIGGYGARFVWKSCLFWSFSGCIMGGCMFGLGMAGVVSLSASVTVNSWWAKALFELWGFFAVGYIGFPTRSSDIYLIPNKEDKLHLIVGCGIISYLLASGLIWFVVWLHH